MSDPDSSRAGRHSASRRGAGGGPRGQHRPRARPLSWRAEVRRQWGRRRTRAPSGCSWPCPLILVIAFAFGDARQPPRWRDDADLRPRAERARRTSASSRLPRVRAAPHVSSPRSSAGTPCRARRRGRRCATCSSRRCGGPACSRASSSSASARPLLATVLLPAWALARRWHRLRLGAADQPRGGPHLAEFLPRLALAWATSSSPCCRSRPSPSGSAPAPTLRSRRSAGPCSSASCSASSTSSTRWALAQRVAGALLAGVAGRAGGEPD